LVAVSVLLVLLAVVLSVVPFDTVRPLFSSVELPQSEENPMRRIVGELRYAPSGKPDQRVQVAFNVAAVSRASLTGTGSVHWSVTVPDGQAGASTTDLDAEVQCVLFGTDQRDGDPTTAVVVSQITHKEGAGPGRPGEYAMFWVRDNGDNDSAAIVPYRLEPLIDFFPAYESAPCGLYVDVKDVGADAEIVAESSNLAISR
jgi:hypothetical protein